MSDGLIIGAVTCLLGAGLFFGGVRDLVSGVSLYRNAAVSVREVPRSEAPVEFDGRADPPADEGAFEAPFSGEEALCCEVWMEKRSRYSEDGDGPEIRLSEEPRPTRETETVWGLADADEIRRPFAVSEGGARVAVDPTGADLEITGHMGESVLTVGEGETLPEEVRARLEALDRTDVGFDCAPETWDDEDGAVRYREARLEPGTDVHVAGAAVRSVPETWGSGVDATVGESTDGRFRISEGTESTVVRRHFVRFATGVTVGAALLGLGGRALWLTLAV